MIFITIQVRFARNPEDRAQT